MSDSFPRYWRNLEAIIPVKVEFAETGLAFGLPRAADRHGHGQASSLGPETIPKGRSLLPRNRKDIRLRGGASTTTRRPDLSWPQTLYYVDADTLVRHLYSVRSITKQANI